MEYLKLFNINTNHQLAPVFKAVLNSLEDFTRWEIKEDNELNKLLEKPLSDALPEIEANRDPGLRRNLLHINKREPGKESINLFSVWLDTEEENIGLSVNGMLWDWLDDSYQTGPYASEWNELLDKFEYDPHGEGDYRIYSLAEEV